LGCVQRGGRQAGERQQWDDDGGGKHC
jgi:hypothetical protein